MSVAKTACRFAVRPRQKGCRQLMMLIREAASHDRDAVRAVHRRAFAGGEGCSVATLASNLLSEEMIPAALTLVAEMDGKVVGHIAFSPVSVEANQNFEGFILAPLGVIPEYQGRGIGSKLVQSGIERLSETGADMIFVYGDPKYYGKFGFETGTARPFLPPYTLTYPSGWLAMRLDDAGSAGPAGRISCVASLRDPTLW